MKKKIYDDSLIRSIRNRTAVYDKYLAPKADLDTYVHLISNPVATGKPDDFSNVDLGRNSFYDWNLSRNEVSKDTALGDYVYSELDYNTLELAQLYVLNILNILLLKDKDQNNPEIKKLLQEQSLQALLHKEAYNKLLSKDFNEDSLRNDAYLSNLNNKNLNLQFDIIGQTMTELLGKRDDALNRAQKYQRFTEYWNSKLDSEYYKQKKNEPGMNLTDIDTYLYKMPGLMGSSASTIGSLLISTGGGAVVGLYGLNPIAAIGGTLAVVGGNMYSRDLESKAEVYQNYKQALTQASDKVGITDKVLKEAKTKLLNTGDYNATQLQDRNFVMDLILLNKVNVDDVEFNRLRIQDTKGLRSLYMDNMALSANDIVQTALEVMPLGSIAKSVKGLNKLEKVILKAEKVSDKFGNVKQQLASRIDDVTTFGIDNIDKLPRLTTRKMLKDLGGRIVLTSAMEGAEEGVLYIQGQRYINNEFDANPNLIKSYVKNLGTGARAIYAAITPWDPVYSDDKEFLENFKGGAILGGLTTSFIGGVTSIKPLTDLLSADQFVSSLYSENLDVKDRVRKNILYADKISKGQWENVQESFKNLKNLNIEGLEQLDIDSENKRAELIYNLYTSNSNMLLALNIGIDPRTDDYKIYTALKEHQQLLVVDSRKQKNSSEADITELLYGLLVSDHISNIKPDANIDELILIRSAILYKAQLDALNLISEQFDSDGKKLLELLNYSKLRTSKADVMTFANIAKGMLNNIKDKQQLLAETMNTLGINEQLLEVPTIHLNLKTAIEGNLAHSLDYERAILEDKLMNTSSGAIAKIEKWKGQEKKSDELVLKLNDIYSGKLLELQETIEKEINIPEVENTIKDKPIELIIPEDSSIDNKLELEMKDAMNDFVEQGLYLLEQNRLKQELERQRLAQEEEQQVIAKQLADKIAQEAIERQQQLTLPTLQILTVSPALEQPKELIQKVEEDIPTLGSLLSGLIGEEAAQLMEQLPVQELATLLNTEELQYDKNVDGLSHELNYRLTKKKLDSNGMWSIVEELRFLGMEQYLNNSGLSKVSTNSDFIEEVTKNGAHFEVTNYTDKNGQTSPAIYIVLPYKGKEYIAAVKTVNGLTAGSRNSGFNSYSYDRLLIVVNNLNAVRSKILNMWNWKQDPNLQLVPTVLRVTAGKIVNEKNSDNSPKNRSLLDSAWLKQKDPYKITPENTFIGISTGPLGGSIIRLNNQVVSVKGSALGQPYWIIDVLGDDSSILKLPVKINYTTFKDKPQIADLIVELLLSNKPTYIDANGTLTNINPRDLLKFIVNFGTHTVVNQLDNRFTPDLLSRKLERLFFIDELNNLILGTNKYSLGDIVSNTTLKDLIKQYIMDKFHYSIDEDGLTKNYLGGGLQSKVRDPHFEAVASFLKNSDVDKITIIPNVIEFSLLDFGIERKGNNKVVSDSNPNGISVLGWYIKLGILLTDIADNLLDANIYFDDVMFVDKTVQKLQKKVEKKIVEQQNDITFNLPNEEGGRTDISLNDMLSMLDGKLPEGPNMELNTSDILPLNNELLLDKVHAKQWLSDKLGLDNVYVLNTVIDITESGASVVGKAIEDSILLSELAPIGTEYHEAWHRVSQLLIEPKVRTKLYNKYNKKHNSNFSDSQIDEFLAEDFREFMLYADDKLDTAFKYDFESKNWFRRILDFIRLWAKTGQYAIAKIITDINTGKYYGIKPNLLNIERFKLIYFGKGANFEVNGYKLDTITTQKQFDDINKSLMYAFFGVDFANKSLDYSQLSKLKPDFTRLKLIVQALATKFPSPVMNEIYSKFEDIFAPSIAARLKQLGIRTIDKIEDNLADIEEAVEGVNIGQHTVEGMNISIKDNAPAEVKFFFQTIPNYVYGQDGKEYTKLDSYTKFPSFIDSKKAWDNVLKDLSGCRTIKNIVTKIAQLAQNDLFYKALLLKFSNLIQQQVSEDQAISTNAEALLTKLETVITADINNYVTAKITSDENDMTVMKLVDNTIDYKAAKYPKIWSQTLFNSSNIFKYNDTGEIVALDQAKTMLSSYVKNMNQIYSAFANNRGILRSGDKVIDFHEPSKLEALKDLIVRYYNAIGIGIDKATINRMLRSGDYGSTNSGSYTLLNNFVVNTVNYGGFRKIIEIAEAINKSISKDGKVGDIKLYDQTATPKTILNNVGYVKTLANYYAAVHATDKGLSSLGAEGNTYYMVSQNNFAKDRINELINDLELVQQLDAVVYNKGSILLDAVKKGNKEILIETLINFKDETTYDVGRDYFGIVDREDYLAKMTATFNDRLIFPTVADKKTYHFIKGLKLPHESVTFNMYENGGVTATYGEQSLDILLGYCYDELNQIELCLKLIDDNPKHFDNKNNIHYNEDGTINSDWLIPSRRIKNFHTPNKYEYEDENDKKHKITLEGNGARFLFLTGIYTTEGFINFNDPKKSAIDNLRTAKDYFFNLSKDSQKILLSGVISLRIKEEVQYAKSLGLIESNEQNNIWSLRNKLLDDTVVQSRTTRYAYLDANNAEGYAIWDIIADYTINSMISVNEIEKMLSGAPAYYKVKYDRNGIVDLSVDKIKRLGSLTSTGLNNRLDFPTNNPIRQEYKVAELKDHEIAEKLYSTYEYLFTYGNIKETILETLGEEAWNSVKGLSFKEIETKFPKEVVIAKQAAIVEVSGYKEGINVADAAVYISPNMFRDLMRMQGKWNADIKLAFEILTNDETADKWESDPELYAKANKTLLNSLKYIAFGTRLNEVPGLGIPYFNKMALFPLFKSVATGDIKSLYDRMVDSKDPLDMVMFDSAVKAGSRSPMSSYRLAQDSEIELKDGLTVLSARLTNELYNEEGNTLNDFNNLVTYTLKFKYLRLQLLTEPHTHEEQMAGTLFLKVNMSNLRMNDMYGPVDSLVSGKYIKDTIINGLNRLSDIGKEKLQSRLFTEDGKLNITKLGDMLLSDARESDANDNVISGLKTKDDAFVIPLSALSDNKWIESRFISMINKEIIDVNLPGGAFIQRSAFGLEATSTKVITPNMINDGRVLLSINEEGSMDAIVSINLFKHIIPGYKKMTFTLAREWLIKRNVIGHEAKANTIGYRIPTQSIASISALRFVDVFPEIMGDTIMLPEGFTKLTGSDFDIDKLFVARYSLDNEGQLITEGEEGIKNSLLDAYMKVLLTKDNTNSLKLSIDNSTENVKAVLKDIESSRTTSYVKPLEVYTPSYQEARKAEYTGGKAGIGPFALNNAHHILTQLTGLKMESNEFTEALSLVDLGRIYDYPTSNGKLGGRILDWLSAMINGFVDIAKDPYIVRLNVNAWTYNMVAFLLRTGKGAQTFYFVSQPILKEMADEVLKTKGKYGIDRTKTPSQLEREAINKVLDKYDPDKKFRKHYAYVNSKDTLSAAEYQDLFSTYMQEGKETSRTRQLLKYGKEGSKGEQRFNEEQVRIYYAWLKLKPYADDLANLVKYSKIDTKKTGKSFMEQLNYYSGMQDLTINSKFADGEVRRFYDETFIGRKTENSIPFGTSIFKNLLLRNTDTFILLKEIVLSLLGRKGNADNKLLGSVVSGMEALIKTLFFNQYVTDNNIDIISMFKGEKSMAKRLNNLKSNIIKGGDRFNHLLNSDGTIANDFLEYLLPNINNEGLDFIDTSELLAADLLESNNLINYWRELLEDTDDQIRKFAEDLAVYAFYTSGDNTTMNSFFLFLPNSYRQKIGYTEYISGKLDQLSNESQFVYNEKEDLFLNNWTNDKLVRPINMYSPTNKSRLMTISFTKLDAEKDIPQIIMGLRLDKDSSDIMPSNWIKITDQNGKTNSFPLFPPYIKVRDSLGFTPENYHVYAIIGYKLKAELNDSNKPTGRMTYTPIYGLINKKGYKYKGHTIVEYGTNTRFDFNKENVYNYVEALNNKEALIDMADEYEKDLWQQDINNIHIITDIPSYQGMNYAKLQQDRMYIEELEDIQDDYNPVLDEKEDANIQTEKVKSMKTYTGTIDKLNSNQIFVFGSNTQGRHGKDAALTAKNKFGAVYGLAEGRQGLSYAIITKDLTKSVHPSRTKELIVQQISNLYSYAKQNPELEFMIAYSGIGNNLNAYSNQEMADMFSSLNVPNNIVFEDSFSKLVGIDKAIIKPSVAQLTLPFYTEESLKGLDLVQLYEDGIVKLNEVLVELELTAEEKQTYENEFTQLLTDDNVDSYDKLEEALRKFICNL